MSGYLNNSAWKERFGEKSTVHELLLQVADGVLPLEDFMRRYKRLVLDYLRHFLSRHKIVGDETKVREASAEIWRILLESLPEKIADQWRDGASSFRDILREAVHEAHFNWSRPDRSEAAVRSRILPNADDDAGWLRSARADVIEKARARLLEYQRVNQNRNNVYHTLFCLWDEDHDQSHAVLSERLAAAGHRLSPENFRKTIGRAVDSFGRYLGEAVGDWIAKRGPVTSEDYARAFEELDLMEYAEKSNYCKEMMDRLDV